MVMGKSDLIYSAHFDEQNEVPKDGTKQTSPLKCVDKVKSVLSSEVELLNHHYFRVIKGCSNYDFGVLVLRIDRSQCLVWIV